MATTIAIPPLPHHATRRRFLIQTTSRIRTALASSRSGHQDGVLVEVPTARYRELAVGFLDPADDQAFIDRVAGVLETVPYDHPVVLVDGMPV